ncbi:MAG: hypothetical protein AVDCRST_MAG26-2638, partial [uncultured Chloroflexia bacterium]
CSPPRRTPARSRPWRRAGRSRRSCCGPTPSRWKR